MTTKKIEVAFANGVPVGACSNPVDMRNELTRIVRDFPHLVEGIAIGVLSFTDGQIVSPEGNDLSMEIVTEKYKDILAGE